MRWSSKRAVGFVPPTLVLGSGPIGIEGLLAERDKSRVLRRADLAPYPAEGMTCWPMSARVGNVKNNDPSLIEPIVVV